MNQLDRRRLLQATAVLIGVAALPASAIGAVSKRPPVLYKQALALLSAVADTVIPRTDTPGSIQVGVPETFHSLLRDWASPATLAMLIAALQEIDSAAVNGTGKMFARLAPDQRKQILSAHDTKSYSANPGYTRLKDLICTLYYFSEPGATVELRYEHVPGEWIPSIPLTTKSRTWAGAAG